MLDDTELDNVETPLSVSFGEMHIRPPSPPPSPPGTARRLPSSHLVKRADVKRHSWAGPPGMLGRSAPVIKVGSGDSGFMRKVKTKKRPFPLQKRSTELCLAFMTKRFTEEEAELATLSLDFAEELERRQQKDTALRCPAPDPSAMNRRSILLDRPDRMEASTGDEELGIPIVGIRPRTQRTRSRLVTPVGADLFDSSEDEEEEESTPIKEIVPPRPLALDVNIPTLDFAKLSKAMSPRPGTPGSAIISPHASPPSPSSPPGISKPDCAKYYSIQSSPRSAFVKPNSA